MNSARHLTISVVLAFLITVIGTVGYMMVEGWDFMDALYMTVITISTVGYSEVRQVDAAGRIFTILIVITGVGFSLYVAGAVVQFMVEGQIRKIMGRRRLDQKLKRPKVTSFLDSALSTKRKDILMEELPVGRDLQLANVTLKDSGIRQRYNLIVIAIEKSNGEMLFNPSFEARIEVEDTLIAVGEEPNLH